MPVLSAPGFSGRWWREHALFLLFLAGWLLAIAVANPAGEFPTNDDWSYARFVQNLQDTGSLHGPSTWVSMTLIAHVIWGFLFSWVFGFSFFVLRLSGIVMGAMGLLGMYVLLCDLKFERFQIVLGLAMLGFSPWYFHLSCSFMTDVPFVVLSLWATLFFLRELRNGSRRAFYLGMAFSISAVLVRQYAVLLPIGWGAATLLGTRLTLRSLWRAAWPGMVVVGLFVIFQGWISPALGMGNLQSSRLNSLVNGLANPRRMLVYCGNGIFVLILYMGLIGLPVWLLSVSQWRKLPAPASRSIRNWFIASLASLIGAFILRVGLLKFAFDLKQPLLMPMINNVFTRFGMGPMTLTDIEIRKLSNLPGAPNWALLLLTILALVSGAAMITILARKILEILRRPADAADRRTMTFLLVSSGGYFFVLAITGFFDRYLINFIPAILILLALTGVQRITVVRWWRLVALAPLLPVILTDIAATHDYFSWNRVRWQVLRDLTASGVSVQRIDGGFEFNAWYNYSPTYCIQDGRSWWWVTADDYMMAFGPVAGFDIERTFPFRTWLFPGHGRLCLLRRATEEPELIQPPGMGSPLRGSPSTAPAKLNG
jgi:hypothetical protein